VTRATSITITITAPDMGAVREWLAQHGPARPRKNNAALWLYVRCQLESAGEWDGVFLSMRGEEPPPR
jgi:hypothetical protein